MTPLLAAMLQKEILKIGASVIRDKSTVEEAWKERILNKLNGLSNMIAENITREN